MREDDILDLIAETAAAIADYCGMNVPYCESMDMSLFHTPVYAMMDDYDFNDFIEEEARTWNESKDKYLEDYLSDLHFLAENNRILPDSLEDASLEEIRAYCEEHRDEILDEIEEECNNYLEAYSDYDEDDD